MSDKSVTEVVLADAEGCARAADILAAGGLVAVPTETVYGLAARADSAEAVAKIYAAKGRPDFNPLIVHVRDVEQAKQVAHFDTVDAEILADFAWPGPLTLVLPLSEDAGLAHAVTAGLATVALRAPAHPVMRQLLAKVDFPIAAPSANRSGFISPTSANHVLESLDGRIDLILDAGVCERGVESTIVAVRPDRQWVELRPGPIDLQELHDFWYDDVVKSRPISAENSRVEAPGQLASHYSPGKPVRLNAWNAARDEFFIGIRASGRSAGFDYNLSSGGDLHEAAARLYDALHQAAASDKPRIAVAPIPNQGVGRAINDRLRRAAAPQD